MHKTGMFLFPAAFIGHPSFPPFLSLSLLLPLFEQEQNVSYFLKCRGLFGVSANFDGSYDLFPRFTGGVFHQTAIFFLPSLISARSHQKQEQKTRLLNKMFNLKYGNVKLKFIQTMFHFNFYFYTSAWSCSEHLERGLWVSAGSIFCHCCQQ